MPDSLVTLEFTQTELRVILAIMNHAFQRGGLGTGDVLLASPVIKKLDEKLVKEEAPIEEPKVKVQDFYKNTEVKQN
jgi:hypothetical protein